MKIIDFVNNIELYPKCPVCGSILNKDFRCQRKILIGNSVPEFIYYLGKCFIVYYHLNGSIFEMIHHFGDNTIRIYEYNNCWSGVNWVIPLNYNDEYPQTTKDLYKLHERVVKISLLK